MNRRLFLEGVGALSMGSLLASCGSTSSNRIRLYLLRRTLPLQLIKAAKRSLSPTIPVNISVTSTVAEQFGQLQRWQIKNQTEAARISQEKTEDIPTSKGGELRLMGLGDYWLSQAIRNQLIDPLDFLSPKFDVIPEPQRSLWKILVQRDAQGNPSDTGQIWGAPYRWGATLLVYRKDKLKNLDWELKDWSDLWRPELQQKVGLLNHPREVIGMTLKTLGLSYNESRLDQQTQLSDKLRSLHQQTRAYSSKNYIQPLILGDTWVTMGWSSDIIPALSQDDNLGVIFPASGSAIWADVWVKGRSQNNPDQTDFPTQTLLSQWVEYWWQENVAHDISRFTDAASIIPPSPEHHSKNVSQRRLTEENLARSEFLLPLEVNVLNQYQSLWQTMRAAPVMLSQRI